VEVLIVLAPLLWIVTLVATVRWLRGRPLWPRD
jgi:hypothetical protein